MHADMAIHLLAELFWTGLLICIPIMGISTLVGVVIGVLQAVTQIQEMTLTFIPKLVATALAIIFFGPWMTRTLAGYATRLWTAIPALF